MLILELCALVVMYHFLGLGTMLAVLGVGIGFAIIIGATK